MVNAIQVLQTVKYFTEQAESTEKLLRLGILRGGVQGKVRLDKQLKKNDSQGETNNEKAGAICVPEMVVK